MDTKEYIDDRLDDQIEWYSKKSSWNQKMYKRLQMAEIIIAALIPVLAAYTKLHWTIPAIISIFGASIVIIEAITKLYKFHENWLQYRTTSEILKHEKYLFLTSSYPYNEKSLQLLVERIESIISSENVNWSQLNNSKKDKSDNSSKT